MFKDLLLKALVLPPLVLFLALIEVVPTSKSGIIISLVKNIDSKSDPTSNLYTLLLANTNLPGKVAVS